MRYYASVASLILPTLEDRPLVLKRFPNGVDGEAFFQQKAPEHTPAAVRVETIESDGGEEQQRIVGGDLATLLYTVQLGCISVDPWLSRVGSLGVADFAVLDLDPGPQAGIDRILAVGRWLEKELHALELHGAAQDVWVAGNPHFSPLASAYADTTRRCCWHSSWPPVWPTHTAREATVERSREGATARGRLRGLPAERPRQERVGRLCGSGPPYANCFHAPRVVRVGPLARSPTLYH